MDQRHHMSQYSHPTLAASSFSEELRLPTEVLHNCDNFGPNLPSGSLFYVMANGDLSGNFICLAFPGDLVMIHIYKSLPVILTMFIYSL